MGNATVELGHRRPRVLPDEVFVAAHVAITAGPAFELELQTWLNANGYRR